MTARTVREAIAKLEEWYKDDLDQLITIYTHDRDELWHNKVEDSNDDELLAKYPTPKDLPDELLEIVFTNYFDGDNFWEALQDSETYEWDRWHSKKQEEENAKEDEQLWDKE